jgi:hypothetical protein
MKPIIFGRKKKPALKSAAFRGTREEMFKEKARLRRLKKEEKRNGSKNTSS